MTTGPLLSIRGLSVSFDRAGRVLRDVSMSVHPGRTLAVVGESGSGKSLTALAVLGLLPPGARVDAGEIGFDGADLLRASPEALRRVRGRRIAMVFQEPMTALNPVMTIGEQIVEVLALHRRLRGRAARDAAAAALAEVGIPDGARRLGDYPHEFSGGMRQRVLIATAIACEPAVLIADEPTTALDAVLRRQVLDLLMELRARRGLGLMLISHDLGLVARCADEVCVMRGGRVVESGPARRVLEAPADPYTRALIECVPKIGERRERLATVSEYEPRASASG